MVAPKGSVMSNAASAKCPLCGTPTTQTQQALIQERVREIQDGARAEEQAKLCAQHEAELKKATAAAAQKARQEGEQKLAVAQRNQMQQADRIAKLEADALTQRADATKVQQQLKAQYEKNLKVATTKAAHDARRDVEQKLADAQLKDKQQAERISNLEAAAATQRANASRAQELLRMRHVSDLKLAIEKATKDARVAVAKELNTKDAELRAAKESHAEELKQLHQTLDEHRDLEIQKITLANTRDKEALQKKVQELNRKLEQKTAHELGEFPEFDLHQALTEAFPGDKIRRVKKGEPGADIIHEVMHNGLYCQTIVYDSKNRRLWQNLFVQKLHADKVAAKAEHAILVSAVFPNGQRDLCVVDDVIVARMSQVVTIAKLLRDSIITDHLRNLSFKDRTEKKERLYQLITSEMFRQRMATIERSVRELEKIDTKEAEEHRRVWAARTVQYRTADKSVRDLLAEIQAILERPVAQAATGTDNPNPF
jgi:hypothetical protein